MPRRAPKPAVAVIAVLGTTLAAACSKPDPAPSTPADAPAPADAAMSPGDDGHTMHRGHDDAMHHRFEDAEAWAKAFDDPARDAWQKPEAVVAKLGLKPSAHIADIGAGTGYFTVRLAEQVPDGRVFAIDVEPDMVRYLRERADKAGLANVVAVEGAADDPRLTEPVDVVFICNTAHHISGRARYFETVATQLVSDGRIVVVDFLPDAPEDAPGPPRKHRLAPATLVAELSEAGFAHLETDATLLPYQYIAVFARRAPSGR